MIQKFKKKPVVIEALQFNASSENLVELSEFLDMEIRYDPTEETLAIWTLEGIMMASKNDWIIKGVAGEFYPCKPDIFEQTYELADEQFPR